MFYSGPDQAFLRLSWKEKISLGRQGLTASWAVQMWGGWINRRPEALCACVCMYVCMYVHTYATQDTHKGIYAHRDKYVDKQIDRHIGWSGDRYTYA